MTVAWTRHAAILVTLAAALVIVACGVGELSLAGKACPCVTGYSCDTTTNTCVTTSSAVDAAPICADAGCSCSTNADCHDTAFPTCVGAQCVACSTSPDSCVAGYYCVDTKNCAYGCKSDAECTGSGKFCDTTRHACLDCRTSADCTNGLQCTPSGSCTIACEVGGDAASTSCPNGQSCCGGFCIDTSTDVRNCKTCGNVCKGSGSQECCGGTCTDVLSTTTSCGTCETSCSTTNDSPSCAAGACVFACSPGFCHTDTANDGCTTPSNSLHVCGSCFNDCSVAVLNASGVGCDGAACTYTTCNFGYGDCDGKASNGCECKCGGDSQTCCPGSVCHNGTTCNTATNRCGDG